MKIDFTVRRSIHHFLNPSVAHTHSDLEVLICLEDGGRFLLEDRYYPLVKGSVFVVKAETPHYCIVEVSSYERFIVHMPYETLILLSNPGLNLISLFESCAPYRVFNEQELEMARQMIERFLELKPSLLEQYEKNLSAMEIILFLLKTCRKDEPNTAPLQSGKFLKVTPIIEYIHEHYASDIDLTKLSQEFYISKYYLSRLFKEATGFNISDYIKNHRIRQACLLLRKGLSVQAVGDSVGYPNSANFIRIFREVMNITPGKYAKGIE